MKGRRDTWYQCKDCGARSSRSGFCSSSELDPFTCLRCGSERMGKPAQKGFRIPVTITWSPEREEMLIALNEFFKQQRESLEGVAFVGSETGTAALTD